MMNTWTKVIRGGRPEYFLFLLHFAALDWGGPRREWFELICKALFDTTSQLFTRFSDNNQALVSLSSSWVDGKCGLYYNDGLTRV